MIIILGVIFQGLTSFLLASIFNLSVLFFVSFFAFIILNIEILSLFKGIAGQNILILTFVEAVVLTLIWLKLKKPVLKLNFSLLKSDIKNAFQKDKSLFILSIVLVFTLAISFLLCFTPPNEADASSYHCLRALFWAKDGFISHFETADIRCHSMPINSELFYVWVLSLSKNDVGFGLLQFFSYFLLIISSFKVMEFYEIDFNKRIWSILIFSSFAGVISQISSTQTDLLVASLLITSFYLILEFKKQNKIHLLYFASLSMAISFGVKSTGVIASIPLLIWYIFLLRKEFIKYFLFLILNFTIFSSYNYVLNAINYHFPLGAKSAINEHSLYYNSPKTFILGVFSNVIRYCFSILDFSGIVIFYLLSPLYDNLVHFVFNLANINPLFNSNGEIPKLNAALFEHTIGLGILSFLYVLPCFIKGFFDSKLKSFVIVFTCQTLLLSAAIVYFPTSIRFFISFLVFLIPTFSLMYKNGNYKFFITLIACLYLIFTPLFLVQRPFLNLLGEFVKKPDIHFLMDNIRDVRYKFYFISKSHIFLKDEVEKICSGNKIGIFLSEGFMAYPTKFLDFQNKCKIDLLTIDKSKNLSNYDFLIYEDNLQEISTVKDFRDSFSCKVTNYIDRPTGKLCYIDKNNFEYEGFILYKTVIYSADKFLKQTGNDNNKSFFILKKHWMICNKIWIHLFIS